MNAAETLIAKKVLDLLHDEDGHQVHSVTIHAGIGGLAACDTRFLEQVLQRLHEAAYTNKVKSKFRGELWNITDAGEAARLQM